MMVGWLDRIFVHLKAQILASCIQAYYRRFELGIVYEYNEYYWPRIS
jgi:hypothetical protein